MAENIFEISFDFYTAAIENSKKAEINITNIIECFVHQLAAGTNSAIRVSDGKAEPGEMVLAKACQNFNKIYSVATDVGGYSSGEQDFTQLCGHFAKMIAVATGRYVYWDEVYENNHFRGQKDQEYNISTTGLFAITVVSKIKKYWQTASDEQKAADEITRNILDGW